MKKAKEIKEFIENLTGNYVIDLNSLTEQIIKYQEEGEMEAANELLTYAEKLIEEHGEMSEEDFRTIEMDDYQGPDSEELSIYYQKLEEAMTSIMEEDEKHAEKVLFEIRDEISFIRDGIEKIKEGSGIRSFQSLTDEVIFRIRKPKDDTAIVGPELQMFLSFLGSFLMEYKEYDKAKEVLTLALEANPIDANVLLALAKLNRLQGDMESAKRFNRQVFIDGYRLRDFAEAFANEGYFAYKDDNEKMALSLNLMALEYVGENDAAKGNLMILKNKYPKATLASEEEYKAYLKENEIIGQPSQEILGILKMLASKAEDEHNYELALEILSNLDGFVHDEKIHNKIHELIPKYEEEQRRFISHFGHSHGDHTCGCGGHSHHHDHGDDCCGGHGHGHHHDHGDDCCGGHGHGHHHDHGDDCCGGHGHHHDHGDDCCGGHGHHHDHGDDCCGGHGHGHHHDHGDDCCGGHGHGHHHDHGDDCCGGHGHGHHHK
ncbi:hypothetical protein LQU94_01740 [Peptoniphilus sp. KCTC 25270]|uniref:tetratricopeptide repeat protein n=1 Tax=Peptoniphilus sp. KCTC 25270 TaxID=2897414 RepID=UPI001E654D3A|nr:hypothetical protein [Peptoniphilus sp. KCTC 25270]MCD1146837.1 hypothetical protein [Peptoniphilus sp. KCTC 25270]